MALQLIKLTAYPDEIVVTKTGGPSAGCAFFLDFTRPLERHRWFGIHNRFFGLTTALFVPVVHEGEQVGSYVISMRRGEAYFNDVQDLWRVHYPSKSTRRPLEADGLKIIADFASQFPEDSQ